IGVRPSSRARMATTRRSGSPSTAHVHRPRSTAVTMAVTASSCRGRRLLRGRDPRPGRTRTSDSSSLVQSRTVVTISGQGRIEQRRTAMCGRYAATKDPATLVKEFDAVDNTEGMARPDHNVAPTKNVVTVVERHPRDADGSVLEDEPAQRRLRVMRWGLVPFWAKDKSIGAKMINTRAETAASKPAFRKALKRHRCLVPADGWYEWQRLGEKKGKQPYFMTPRDGSSLAFAGIWETWRDPKEKDAPPLVTCSVLTVDAVGPLTDIHDRMPLVLSKDAWRQWLDPDLDDVAEL